MNDDELQRWACVIDDIIKGKDVELVYENVRRAHYAFSQCVKILEMADIPFDAVGIQGNERITVLGTVWFTPMWQDRRRLRP